MAGSTDCFAPGTRAPHASVNFVTAHDGFTLADLVSYEQRHNLANGEHNRDGHGHNLSVNHGVEGPSTDVRVQALRARDRRTLLAMTVLSLGTPMLLAGDELGHSQNGNNNAYCQDNATTWLDWATADATMLEFVSRLLALRHARPLLQSAAWWAPASSATTPDGAAGLPGMPHVYAQWSAPEGTPLSAAQWHAAHDRALQLCLSRGAEDRAHDCLMLLNASDRSQVFQLPPGPWFAHLDTGQVGAPQALAAPTVLVAAGTVWIGSRAPL